MINKNNIKINLIDFIDNLEESAESGDILSYYNEDSYIDEIAENEDIEGEDIEQYILIYLLKMLKVNYNIEYVCLNLINSFIKYVDLAVGYNETIHDFLIDVDLKNLLKKYNII